LAFLLLNRKKTAEATELLRSVYEGWRTVDARSTNTVQALADWVQVMVETRKFEEARQPAKELSKLSASAPLGLQQQAAYPCWYPLCLSGLTEFAQAEPLLIESFDAMQGVQLGAHPWCLNVAKALIHGYETEGRAVEAAYWRAMVATNVPLEKRAAATT